jgi:hypothetical protein
MSNSVWEWHTRAEVRPKNTNWNTNKSIYCKRIDALHNESSPKKPLQLIY